MKNEPMIKVLLSDIDLNYIDSALRERIREHEFTIFKYGKGHGNISVLLNRCKRLQSRLRKVQETSQRKRMGEKKWKEIRKRTNSIIREIKQRAKTEKANG